MNIGLLKRTHFVPHFHSCIEAVLLEIFSTGQEVCVHFVPVLAVKHMCVSSLGQHTFVLVFNTSEMT